MKNLSSRNKVPHLTVLQNYMRHGKLSQFFKLLARSLEDENQNQHRYWLKDRLIVNEKFSCYYVDVSTKIGNGIIFTNDERHISLSSSSSPDIFSLVTNGKLYPVLARISFFFRLSLLANNAISWFVSRSGQSKISFNKTVETFFYVFWYRNCEHLLT